MASLEYGPAGGVEVQRIVRLPSGASRHFHGLAALWAQEGDAVALFFSLSYDQAPDLGLGRVVLRLQNGQNINHIFFNLKKSGKQSRHHTTTTKTFVLLSASSPSAASASSSDGLHKTPTAHLVMRATEARSPAFEVPSPGGTTVTALGSESCSCGAIILETSLGVLSKVFFKGPKSWKRAYLMN